MVTGKNTPARNKTAGGARSGQFNTRMACYNPMQQAQSMQDSVYVFDSDDEDIARVMAYRLPKAHSVVAKALQDEMDAEYTGSDTEPDCEYLGDGEVSMNLLRTMRLCREAFLGRLAELEDSVGGFHDDEDVFAAAQGALMEYMLPLRCALIEMQNHMVSNPTSVLHRMPDAATSIRCTDTALSLGHEFLKRL